MRAPLSSPGAPHPPSPLFLLALAYPVVVYFALTRFGARSVPSGWEPRGRPGLLPAGSIHGDGAPRSLKPIAPLGILALLAVATGEERLLLALPVVISIGTLRRLRPEPPARPGQRGRPPGPAQRDMAWLPPTAEVYCRRVTTLWCAFFLANALVAGPWPSRAPAGGRSTRGACPTVWSGASCSWR